MQVEDSKTFCAGNALHLKSFTFKGWREGSGFVSLLVLVFTKTIFRKEKNQLEGAVGWVGASVKNKGISLLFWFFIFHLPKVMNAAIEILGG